MIWLARGMTAATILLWAMAFIWGKQVLVWVDPFTAVVLRYGIATAALLAITLPRGGLALAVRDHWRAYLVLGVIGVGLYQGFNFMALRYTSPVNSAVIMALTPLLTAAGGALFLGEALTLRAGIGFVISLCGALLAVLGDGPGGIAGFSLDRGEPLALLGGLCMAFYTIASRRLLPPGVPLLASTTVVMAIGTLAVLPLALTEPLPHSLPPPGVVVALAGLSLGGTLFGLLAWTHAARVLGVKEPNTYFNFIPVITMGLAALHGMQPQAEQIVGGLLVVAGVMLSLVPERHRHPAPAHA